MSLIVKICGLKTPEALDVALESGADMVGFVFFPPSPRHLAYEAARALGERVKGRAGKVALTVDADDETFAALIAALKPDLLQLHGKETPDRVADVKRKFGRSIIKALPIEKKGDFDRLKDYAFGPDWQRINADPNKHNWILFDAKAPNDATRPGGLGRPFDWSLIRGALPSVPIMLSGGLNSQNVGEALAITLAPAVDVSSGVESAPGVKDPEKIHEFIRVARDAHMVATRYPYRVSQ